MDVADRCDSAYLTLVLTPVDDRRTARAPQGPRGMAGLVMTGTRTGMAWPGSTRPGMPWYTHPGYTPRSHVRQHALRYRVVYEN